MYSPTQSALSDSSRGINSCITGGLVGATLGIFIGGLLGFVLPVAFYKLTNPQFLNDGQWGMVFLESIPIGVVVGLSVGLVAGLFVGHKVK